MLSVALETKIPSDKLYSMIEEIIFGNIFRINGTLDDEFSSHGSPINDLNQVYKILFSLETPYKLCVIRGPAENYMGKNRHTHMHILMLTTK